MTYSNCYNWRIRFIFYVNEYNNFPGRLQLFFSIMENVSYINVVHIRQHAPPNYPDQLISGTEKWVNHLLLADPFFINQELIRNIPIVLGRSKINIYRDIFHKLSNTHRDDRLNLNLFFKDEIVFGSLRPEIQWAIKDYIWEIIQKNRNVVISLQLWYIGIKTDNLLWVDEIKVIELLAILFPEGWKCSFR